MPSNGANCDLPSPMAECGYVTETNPCGAVNCYCQQGAWGCYPTCVFEGGAPEASGNDGGDASDGV